MNCHACRRAVFQTGMTLLACALVLFGVALLASASLRSQQDSISLTYSAIDRLLAQQAADSALRDAAMSLSMIPTNGVMVQVQGAHQLGDITGEHFPYGGPAQSCAAPEYFLEILPQSGSADAKSQEAAAPYHYRVTATGWGLSQATKVVLQAEFEAQACATARDSDARDKQGNSRNGMDNREQNDEPASGPSNADCVPFVRRIAWRIMSAT